MGQVANSQGDQLKEELVQFEGTVTELLRGGMFRVQIKEAKHEVIAQINGKMIDMPVYKRAKAVVQRAELIKEKQNSSSIYLNE